MTQGGLYTFTITPTLFHSYNIELVDSICRDMLFELNDGQKEDKMFFLQLSQLHNQGESRRMSISAKRHSWRIVRIFVGLSFLRAVLPTKVKANTQAMATNRKTKALITQNQGEFQHLKYTLGQHTAAITMA